MIRNRLLAAMLAFWRLQRRFAPDIVQDWNDTLCTAAETVVTKHNPGVPTRAMAMMNGSIYDIFQAVNRTHQPFKVNTLGPGRLGRRRRLAGRLSGPQRHVSRNAGDAGYHAGDATWATLPDGAAKTAGIDLGNIVAQQYIYCPPERWLGFARRLHADRWTRPLEHRSDGRPEHSKRLGIRLGFGESLGHARSRLLRCRDAVHDRRHEYAAIYGRV